jgi:hypothetical protein
VSGPHRRSASRDWVLTLFRDLDFINFEDKGLFSDGLCFCTDMELGGKVNLTVQRHFRRAVAPGEIDAPTLEEHTREVRRRSDDALVALIRGTAGILNVAARAYIINCGIGYETIHAEQVRSFKTVWNYCVHSGEADLQRVILIMIGTWNPIRAGFSTRETLQGLKPFLRSKHADIRDYTALLLYQMRYRHFLGIWWRI